MRPPPMTLSSINDAAPSIWPQPDVRVTAISDQGGEATTLHPRTLSLAVPLRAPASSMESPTASSWQCKLVLTGDAVEHTELGGPALAAH